MLAVNVGVLLQMLSLQNRQGAEFPHAKWMFILTAGVLLLMAAVFLTEESFPNSQHSGRFYVHASITFPLYLVAAGQASQLRWPATTVAAVYMGLVLFMCWMLPLFSAEPKLAPIYNPVTRMVPPAFPLLLFVPGLRHGPPVTTSGSLARLVAQPFAGRGVVGRIHGAVCADPMVLFEVPSDPCGGQLVFCRQSVLVVPSPIRAIIGTAFGMMSHGPGIQSG